MEELFSKEFEREDVVYLRPNFNPAIPKVIFNDIDLFIFKYQLITGKKITKKIIGNQAIRDFTKLGEFEQEKNIPLLKIIEEYDNENREKFSFVPTKDISEEFRKLEYFYQAQDKKIKARDIHALILLRFLDKVRKCTEYQMGKLGQFESVLFDNAIAEETTVKSYPELEQSKYDLISETNQVEVKEGLPKYTDADFLREVFTTADSLEEMMHLLRRKNNIILQGAPGVGKTFSAKRLAYAMMGKKNDDNIGLVQFHQNYSYEDFIMGYKPEDGDFKLKEGVFFRFCRKALSDPAHDYFFIIDEINRGNMSKIFGELLMLIEKDYRGTYATLPYREERFTVPKNVYLIGMMNTADRSLAMIDYALRRRFSFVEMQPGFDSEGFRAYQESLHSELFDRVVELIKQLNEAICDDDTLGAGFQIGHSYLCGIKPEDCNELLLKEIVKYDILPTLSEYWFDDTDKAKDWAKKFNNLFA